MACKKDDHRQIKSTVLALEHDTKTTLAHMMASTSAHYSVYHFITQSFRENLLARDRPSVVTALSHQVSPLAITARGIGIDMLLAPIHTLFDEYPIHVVRSLMHDILGREPPLLTLFTDNLFHGSTFLYPLDVYVHRFRLTGTFDWDPCFAALPLYLGARFIHSMTSAMAELVLERFFKPDEDKDEWNVFSVVKAGVGQLVGGLCAFPLFCEWLASVTGKEAPSCALGLGSVASLRATFSRFFTTSTPGFESYMFATSLEAILRLVMYAPMLKLWYIGTEPITDSDIEVMAQGKGHPPKRAQGTGNEASS